MTTVPNWVDLVVVILIIRMCYSGFALGLWSGLFLMIGAVVTTAATINFSGVLIGLLRQWSFLPAEIATTLGFWGFFLTLLVCVHALVRRVNELIQWEKLHWFVQGIGIVVGGLRGLWWAGFFLVVLASSGIGYLRDSVETRSLFGPRLLAMSRAVLDGVTESFPGAAQRPGTLVPPVAPQAD